MLTHYYGAFQCAIIIVINQKQTKMKQGLNKKMRFGLHKGKTPKQIIDGGNLDYIEFLDGQNVVLFTPETYEYIKQFKNK